MERNRDDLYNERLPYFGKAVMDHIHFTEWAQWAYNQGLPPIKGTRFGQKMKDFVKQLPGMRH